MTENQVKKILLTAGVSTVSEFLGKYKDGATLSAVTLEPVSWNEGYQVGLTNNVLPANATEDDLVAMLVAVSNKAVALLHKMGKFGCVGVWQSPAGEWFINVSCHYKLKSIALHIGLLYDQQSIWDWASSECVEVKR